MKTNKCSICGWEGSTHLHHIIPISDYGEDTKDNIIEICPNHHSESQNNEEEFAKKYKLIGKRFSESKMKDLSKGALLFGTSSIRSLSEGEKLTLAKIIEKHGFDRIDFIAFMMGITRKSVEAII